MIGLTAQQAGSVLGVGDLASEVKGVSIDSRSLAAGDLFVALRGERFDGHDFVEAALAAGASGAVVEKQTWARRGSGTAGAPLGDRGVGERSRIYEVQDTVEALGALAREVRRISQVTVFAVTGSVGKTSTKDMLKAMVGRVMKVVATASNQNNEVGVPLTLLSVDPETEALVVEMGMRGKGQIAYLAAVAEPDVGLITNVHPVHLELLGTLEDVAAAKAELVAGIKVGGRAVVPLECAPLEPFLRGYAQRLIRFSVGEAHGSGVRGGECVHGWLEGGERGDEILVVRWPEGETRVTTGHLARHTLENAVAALAAIYAAGLPVSECAAGIVDLELSEGRGQIVEAGGLCVVDDSYNANPAAVRAAMGHLVGLAARRGGRAVAVLGDMLELGKESARFHEETGAQVAAAGVSALWGIGPMSKATVKGFADWWERNAVAGQEWSTCHLESSEDVDSLLAGLRRGDVVLVKGSRGVRLEKVVVRLAHEASSGRWGGGRADEDTGKDETGEKRHCYR